jgi:hypothetical protein
MINYYLLGMSIAVLYGAYIVWLVKDEGKAMATGQALAKLTPTQPRKSVRHHFNNPEWGD